MPDFNIDEEQDEPMDSNDAMGFLMEELPLQRVYNCYRRLFIGRLTSKHADELRTMIYETISNAYLEHDGSGRYTVVQMVSRHNTNKKEV